MHYFWLGMSELHVSELMFFHNKQLFCKGEEKLPMQGAHGLDFFFFFSVLMWSC